MSNGEEVALLISELNLEVIDSVPSRFIPFWEPVLKLLSYLLLYLGWSTVAGFNPRVLAVKERLLTLRGYVQKGKY